MITGLTLVLLQLTLPTSCPWQDSDRTPTRIWWERGQVRYQRSYFGTWALCAEQAQSPKPLVRVWADRGKGWEKISESTPKLHGSPSPTMERKVELVTNVCKMLPGPPQGQRVLRGSVGEERWYYPVQVKVEIIAEDAYADLAHQATITAYCEACTQKPGVRAGIVQDYRKNTFKMYALINEDFKKCVGDHPAHQLHVRLFAADSKREADHALIPTVEWRDMHIKVRRPTHKRWDKGALVYEEEFPVQRLCRHGKVLLVETAGLGEYHTGEYRRWPIEPMRCP